MRERLKTRLCCQFLNYVWQLICIVSMKSYNESDGGISIESRGGADRGWNVRCLASRLRFGRSPFTLAHVDDLPIDVAINPRNLHRDGCYSSLRLCIIFYISQDFFLRKKFLFTNHMVQAGGVIVVPITCACRLGAPTST